MSAVYNPSCDVLTKNVTTPTQRYLLHTTFFGCYDYEGYSQGELFDGSCEIRLVMCRQYAKHGSL